MAKISKKSISDNAVRVNKVSLNVYTYILTFGFAAYLS